MKIETGYHGTDRLISSIADIKVDEQSLEQFYGPAFYVSSTKEGAAQYGKYIYEVEFDAEEMFEVSSFLDTRTNGTFQQYLDVIRRNPDEFPIHEAAEDSVKHNITETSGGEDGQSQDEIKDHRATKRLVTKYIKKNRQKLLSEYLEEQAEIKCELEDEYDGIIDQTQCAIYFPQKSIRKITFVEEAPSVVVILN